MPSTPAGPSPRPPDVHRGPATPPIKGVHLATEPGDSLALRAACLTLRGTRRCVIVDRHAGWLLGAQMVLAPGEHLACPTALDLPTHGRDVSRNDLATSGERNLTAGDVHPSSTASE